jgi:hypothetical protein
VRPLSVCSDRSGDVGESCQFRSRAGRGIPVKQAPLAPTLSFTVDIDHDVGLIRDGVQVYCTGISNVARCKCRCTCHPSRRIFNPEGTHVSDIQPAHIPASTRVCLYISRPWSFAQWRNSSSKRAKKFPSGVWQWLPAIIKAPTNDIVRDLAFAWDKKRLQTLCVDTRQWPGRVRTPFTYTIARTDTLA